MRPALQAGFGIERATFFKTDRANVSSSSYLLRFASIVFEHRSVEEKFLQVQSDHHGAMAADFFPIGSNTKISSSFVVDRSESMPGDRNTRLLRGS